MLMDPTSRHAEARAETATDFEGFFQAEYDRLFKAVYLLTGDRYEADDIAQESLLRAYERWDRVASMESPAGYVYRTALNLHRSRRRALAVRARRVFRLVPGEDPSAAAMARQEVHAALAQLPQGQREAIVLVEWLGLPSDEAGRVLGIDAVSVRGRVHRAKAGLRSLLEDVDE